MDRAQPEPDLKQQRKQKWGRIEPHAAQSAGHGADPKGADAKQAKIEDRIFALPRMPAVNREDGQRRREKHRVQHTRKDWPPEIFDGQLQQRQPEPAEKEPA